MSENWPDRWCVIKIPNAQGVLYKVFANWHGGYAGSDSWQLNSGIVHAAIIDDVWQFRGTSGSIYHCQSHGYGCSGYGQGVLSGMIDKAAKNNINIEIMPADTAWNQLQYEPLAQWLTESLAKTPNDSV